MESEVKSSELLNELRDNRRMKLKEHRDFNRLRAFDFNRFEESEIVKPEDIIVLCKRIKSRRVAKAEELIKLGNAFLQSEANITAFIKVTGAINIIIKDFTGKDRNLQILAAQCLCNLSLGDEVCCSKVATFAGSYLMIFILNSNDLTLAKLCLWMTQNIVASGAKAMNILMSQELLKNCLHILNNKGELEHEVFKLLDIIVDGKIVEFSHEDQEDVTNATWSVLRQRSNDPLVLQIFLKVVNLERLSDVEATALITLMVANLRDASLTNEENMIHFTINILQQLLSSHPQHLSTFVGLLIENQVKLSRIINVSVANPKLFHNVKDLLHFLSQLLHSDTQASSQYSAFDSLENLRIPKLFEF